MSKSCVFCIALALCATGCGARLSAGDAKALAEAKAFLAGGGDVNAEDEGGVTIMRQAVWNGHLGTMRYLISKGTDLHELGFAGCSLLQAAASRGRLDAMKLLVTHGVEIDARSRGGGKYTALHYAAWEGSIDPVKLDLVRMLVGKGVFRTARTKGKNLTPLEWAERPYGFSDPETSIGKEIIKILKDAEVAERRAKFRPRLGTAGPYPQFPARYRW